MTSSPATSSTAIAGTPADPGYASGRRARGGAGGDDSDAPAARRSLIGQALYDTFGSAGARAGAVWIAVIAFMAVFAPFLASSYPILMRETGGGLMSPLLRSLGPLDVALVVYFFYALWVLVRRQTAASAIARLLWPVMIVAAFLFVAKYGGRLVTLRMYRPPWLLELTSGGAVVGWTWVLLVNLVVLSLVLGGIVLAALATRRFFATFGRSISDVVPAALAVVLMTAASFLVVAPQNPIYEQYRELERDGRLDLVLRTLIPYSPNDRQRDKTDMTLNPPGRDHWLGTTQYNEDMLSRLLHACRVALSIGIVATGISTVIGVIIGGFMGFFGRAVDLLGMRLLEIIEAIPTLILLLIVTVFFGRSLYLMMIVIGLVTWTSDARFVRAEFLKLRTLDFVHAAHAVGLRRASIIFRHMLPNGIAPVLVNASFSIAGAILYESTLSFLGLGLGPDDPSWGQLLNQARSGGRGFSWWIATYPGLFIFLTVFAYVLIGEAMRDALDPRQRKRD